MGYSVLIIDDHELFSATLAISLRSHGLDPYLAEPVGYDEVLQRAAEVPRGLVVLDLDLGPACTERNLSGADFVTALVELEWKVLIVTGSVDDTVKAAAIAAGAIGLLRKTTSFDDLLDSVVKAAAGSPLMTEDEHQMWLSRHHGHQEQLRERVDKLQRLTPREREVLELLAGGHRAAAIAAQAVVSVTTVRSQIRSILTKLEVNSQLAAVAVLREQSKG